MIESKDDMTATESEEDTTAAKKDVEAGSPEGHDPNDARGGGGAGGEAGATPGVPEEDRTDERGHEKRDEGARDPEDDAPGTKDDR